MLRTRELTTRAAGTEAAQAAALGVPLGIFPYSIKGWSALTCRRKGQVDKQMAAIRQITKCRLGSKPEQAAGLGEMLPMPAYAEIAPIKRTGPSSREESLAPGAAVQIMAPI